ncbi:GGDEF domain-containing protein [Curvibacter sp. CHRR-16]|uniref:diguanylate cyclase domain-containing protein n=1 Tax=Curvibacter sp. CHRR-16 TaxID=2835872 RepID=UPI001BDAA0B7|nr:GGDEF domain-containing protein [Curvibacter sp. CHRR-16]
MLGRCRLLWRIGLALSLSWGCVHAADAPVVLDGQYAGGVVWSELRFLHEQGTPLGLDQVQARLDEFESNSGHPLSTFGVVKFPVWLYLPVQVPAGAETDWVFTIDYPIVQRFDLFLTANGQLVQHVARGSSVARDDAKPRSVAISIPLHLRDAMTYGIWLRVQSAGPMLLPMRLQKAGDAIAQAEVDQLVMGLICGIELTLLLYCLLQWVSLREPVFWMYSLMTFGVMLSNIFFYGLGWRFLWPDQLWVQAHMDGTVTFFGSVGTFLFVGEVLAGGDSQRRRFLWAMRACAALSAVFMVIYLLDGFAHDVFLLLFTLWPFVPSMMAIPYTLFKADKSNSIAKALLLVWAVYVEALLLTFGAMYGWQGWPSVSFWTVRAFPIAAAIDSVLFLYVLGLRSKGVRVAAQRAALERDALQTMAYTDALTGVLNRRGLDTALDSMLTQASVDNQAAVMVLDLDGFKPINDTYGHDVGDVLLRAVAQRLKGQVRSSDLVVRLGGDEFVVVARDLTNALQVQELAAKLLHVLQQPYRLNTTLGNIQVHVGVTIGYALAPIDSTDAFELIKFADMALYEGKRQGKGCVQRYAKVVALQA